MPASLPLLGRLSGRPLLQRLAAGVSWLVFERVVLLALNFFVNVWFVRYLGPERYGVYAYALSFVNLFGSLAALGIESIAVRELSRSEERAGDLLGSAMALRVLSGLASAALAVGLSLVVADTADQRAAVSVAAIGLALQFPTALDGWFQARILRRPTALVRLWSALGTAAAKGLFVLAALPLSAFLWLYVANHVVTGIGMLAAFRRHRPAALRLRAHGAAMKKLLAESWPMLVAGLSVTVYMKIDQVMLGEMQGSAAVGLYATAANLSELWYFLPMAVASSAFPVIVQAASAGDQANLDKRMQLLYDGMVLLSYAIALPLAVLAVPITVAFFGETYTAAGEILAVHIWSFVFVALGSARARYLVARDMVRFSMVSTSLGALLNVVLNLLLIPRFSGVGAAWATLASYAFSGWISGLLVRDLWGQTRQETLALLLPFRLRSFLRSLA